MPVAARAIAAGSLVLLCQRLRRQPDRADGSRLHVPRAAVAGTAGGLVVQAEDVPAVLRELACGLGQRDLFLDGLELFLAELGLGPVRFEDLQNRLHHLRILREQADFAPTVELERAQALTADKRLFTIAHDRSDVQPAAGRSEEHTSELQSLAYLVCRLLLEKKKKKKKYKKSSNNN